MNRNNRDNGMMILNRFYIKDPELEDLRYDDRMDVCWKLLCKGKLADSGFGMAFRSFVSPCLFFRVLFQATLLVSNPQHHAPCRRPTEDPFDETLRGVTASHHVKHHRINAVFWLQKECCKTPLPLHLLYVLALPPLWPNPAK